MQNITIGGVYHELVYGADTPGPIWKDAMTGALEGKEAESFVPVHIPDPKPEKPENPGPDRRRRRQRRRRLHRRPDQRRQRQRRQWQRGR